MFRDPGKRKKTANLQSDQKQLMTDQVRTEQEELRRSDRRIYSSVPPPGQTRACSATKDSTSGEKNCAQSNESAQLESMSADQEQEDLEKLFLEELENLM